MFEVRPVGTSRHSMPSKRKRRAGLSDRPGVVASAALDLDKIDGREGWQPLPAAVARRVQDETASTDRPQVVARGAPDRAEKAVGRFDLRIAPFRRETRAVPVDDDRAAELRTVGEPRDEPRLAVGGAPSPAREEGTPARSAWDRASASDHHRIRRSRRRGARRRSELATGPDRAVARSPAAAVQAVTAHSHRRQARGAPPTWPDPSGHGSPVRGGRQPERKATERPCGQDVGADLWLEWLVTPRIAPARRAPSGRGLCELKGRNRSPDAARSPCPAPASTSVSPPPRRAVPRAARCTCRRCRRGCRA